MKKKQKNRKKAYMKPQLGAVILVCGGGVLEGSFEGGHNDAVDDEELKARRHGFFDDGGSPWQAGWAED